MQIVSGEVICVFLSCSSDDRSREHICVILSYTRIKGNVSIELNKFQHSIPFVRSADRSKMIPLSQFFFDCASVIVPMLSHPVIVY